MAFQVQLKQNTISERELDDAVDVCVRAYVDERASDSMVGGDQVLKGLIFRAMIRAGQLDGQVYFATVKETGKVVGVAIWFPPGKSMFSSEEQRALGFDDFMGKLSPETKSFWETAYVPAVEKFIEETLGPHASPPLESCDPACRQMKADLGKYSSFYLNQLATDPEFQRQGIATLLLKTVHDQYKSSESPPVFAHCAANEANERFYQARGYTTRGVMEMDASTGPYPVIILTK